MTNVVTIKVKPRRDYTRLPQSKALAIKLRKERLENERLGFRVGAR